MKTKKEWPAHRLCKLAVQWLLERYPSALVIEELGFGKYGEGSLDVAAVTADRLIGVEIKGDGDSPSRLALQALQYPKVCQEIWLLSAPSLLDRCRKARPAGWGFLRIDQESDSLAARLEASDLSSDNSVKMMMRTLWREELARASAALNLPLGKRVSTYDHTDALAEHISLRDARPLFIRALLSRDWANMLGTGEAKRTHRLEEAQ